MVPGSNPGGPKKNPLHGGGFLISRASGEPRWATKWATSRPVCSVASRSDERNRGRCDYRSIEHRGCRRRGLLVQRQLTRVGRASRVSRPSSARPRFAAFRLPRRRAGGGVENDDALVKTRAGHLTEGLQGSKIPPRPKTGAGRIVPERLALREHLSPMARLRLRGCAQVSRLPSAPSEPGRWFLLFVYEAPV